MNDVILNRDNLGDINATFALGSLVAAELFRTGQALIFFNIFDEVQLASKEDLNLDPPLPIAFLDELSVDDAVEKLLKANVSEGQICNYLQERKARKS